MTIIIEIIHNYTIVLELVNILVLIINLSLLLFQKKNKWYDYIILLYGGFLFGLIPLFVVFENILVADLGCILLTVAFIYLHNKLETRIYMPLLIMIYKILLVIGITFFSEQYSLHMFDFYLILMCISQRIGKPTATLLTPQTLNRISRSSRWTRKQVKRFPMQAQAFSFTARTAA